MFSDEKVKCFCSVAFMSPHSHSMNYEVLRVSSCHQVTMFNEKEICNDSTYKGVHCWSERVNSANHCSVDSSNLTRCISIAPQK